MQSWELDLVWLSQGPRERGNAHTHTHTHRDLWYVDTYVCRGYCFSPLGLRYADCLFRLLGAPARPAAAWPLTALGFLKQLFHGLT